MTVHTKNRRTTLIAASLLLTLGSACSSDDEGNSASSSATTATSPAATDAPPATGSGGAGGTTSSIDDRIVVVEQVLAQGTELGIAFDNQCVFDLVAQLSDADAKLLADSARAGAQQSPTLSAEGEALGEQLLNCAPDAATTTLG